jgi:hypothetical protein
MFRVINAAQVWTVQTSELACQIESHQNESVSCDTDYHGGSVFSGEEYNEYL